MKNLTILLVVFFALSIQPSQALPGGRKFTKCIAHSHQKTKVLVLDFADKGENTWIHFHNYGLSHPNPQMLIDDKENWTDAAGLFKCIFTEEQINCKGDDESKSFSLIKTGQFTGKIDFQMSKRARSGLEVDFSSNPENCILFEKR